MLALLFTEKGFFCIYHADVRRQLYYGGRAQGESLACLPDSNYSQSKKKKKQSPKADKARTTSGEDCHHVCPLVCVPPSPSYEAPALSLGAAE